MHRSVLIYQDYVHNNGLLYRALRDHFGRVDYCDAGDIKNGVLNDDIALFVMPGGADLYYCEKLNGAGNAAIRRYVESGGRYLGICAGAYYACSSLMWAEGSKHEISGSRELAFYNGMAVGPVVQLMENMDGSWLGAATLSYDGRSVKVCYEAGPYFSEPVDQSVAVLARYADLPGQPPAILECAIGLGKAILTGPHIECIMPAAAQRLYLHMNRSHDYESRVNDTLAPHGVQQQALWDHILSRLVYRDLLE